MIWKIIKQILRIVLGVATYIIAIYFFIGRTNKFLDFFPYTFQEAVANMKCIPFFDYFKVLFRQYFDMIWPVGVLAAFTDLFAIARICFRGIVEEMEYELDHNDYYLMRNGQIIGEGSDGGVKALGAVLFRFLIMLLILPCFFFLKPIILVVYVVKLVMIIVKAFTGEK